MVNLFHPLLLKHTCRVLSKGIGKVFAQLSGDMCPPRVSSIRTLHCVCRTLDVPITLQQLSPQLLCKTWRTQLPLHVFLQEADESSLDEATLSNRVDLQEFRKTCCKIIQFRTSLRAPIPPQLKQVCSWNLNSLQTLSHAQG